MTTPKRRVIIENVRPVLDRCCFPIRWVVGDQVRVKADILAEGHDQLAGELLFRKGGAGQWQALPMALLQKDVWYSTFRVTETGTYEYTVQAWIDRFRTWLGVVGNTSTAGRDVGPKMMEGARIVAAAAEQAGGEDGQWLAATARFLDSNESSLERMRVAGDPHLSRLMDAYADKRGVSVYGKVLQVTVERPIGRFSVRHDMIPYSCMDDPQRR